MSSMVSGTTGYSRGAKFSEVIFLQFLTGGMPDAVQSLLQTKKLSRVLQIQRGIVGAYIYDIRNCRKIKCNS